MNLLLAISETPPHHSGIARTADRLEKGYITAGHNVSVLSTRDTGRVLLGEMRLTGLLARWPALRKMAGSVDVVSVHGPAPTFSDVLLLVLWLRRRRHGTPRIVYTHHFDIDFPPLSALSSLYNWMHGQLARLADRVVVTTPGYASRFAAFAGPGRLTVIPWGTDGLCTSPRSEKNGQFTVLFVGQLRRYKGVETLIRAARYVPQASVVVVGQGPEREHLEEVAANQKVRNVTFLGSVSDAELDQLYRLAHVVVLPSVSRLEAFGIVLLEGMAAGCVPVASALPGVSDVVGDSGHTFQPGDAAALAEILVGLSKDESERNRLSEQAQLRSLQFTWERTVSSYLTLFESLLEESSARMSLSSEPKSDLERLGQH